MMFTVVPPPTPAGFDLGAAVAAAWPAILRAYPDWTGADQAGLAAAIQRDAAAFVAANNIPVGDPDPNVLVAVEARLFESFLATLPGGDPVAELPEEPDGAEIRMSPSRGTIDLVAEIAELTPYLTREQCQVLAGEVYTHLESLTGECLTEGMSDAQLDEFGYFVDQDVDGIEAWFAANLPGYEADEGFRRFVEANPEASRVEVLAEFGAQRWLQMHRPDYPQVVAQQLAGLKEALAELVAEAGEGALGTWARIRDEWAQMLQRADGEREVIAGAARLVDLEGVDEVAQWALVENQLRKLDERAAALGGAR